MGIIKTIASSVGGFLGGPIGAAAMDFAGDMFTQTTARDAYKHRYQDTVQDMRKAGLNPALAYGQNPGGGANTANFGDLGSKMATAKQAMANATQTKAETNLLRAQTADLIQGLKLRNALIGRQTEQAASQTDLNTSRTNLNWLEERRQKATLQSDIDAQIAANLQQQLQTPEARARSKYYEQTGTASFYLNNALDIAKAGAAVYGAKGLNRPSERTYRRYR